MEGFTADELRALLIVVVGQSSDEWKTDLALSRCINRALEHRMSPLRSGCESISGVRGRRGMLLTVAWRAHTPPSTDRSWRVPDLHRRCYQQAEDHYEMILSVMFIEPNF